MRVTAKTPAFAGTLVARGTESVQQGDKVETRVVEYRGGTGSRDTSTFGNGDLRDLVLDGIGVFAEWPHVDKRFTQLYRTLAGSAVYDSYDESTRTDDTDYQERMLQASREQQADIGD